jgi:non-homologous end joining protein Ku
MGTVHKNRKIKSPPGKVENRQPELTIASEGKPTAPVINIMAALKESMQAKGRVKVRDAVRKRSGKW